MVCNKIVCERWCVTMLLVKKLCVCEKGCVAKMVCNTDVCERWCVAKMYVKDGVRQKMCVKNGVRDQVV